MVLPFADGTKKVLKRNVGDVGIVRVIVS